MQPYRASRHASPVLAGLLSLTLVGVACGFPEKDFIPDDQFNATSEGGSSGAGGGQGGTAGNGGSSGGTAGNGGAGTAGTSGAGNGGDSGTAGDAGAAGDAGMSGAAGESGAAGDAGAAGSAGEAGAAGEAGEGGAAGGGAGGAAGGGAGGDSGNGGAPFGGSAGSSTCHDACEKGPALEPSCSPCAAAVCATAADCCNPAKEWSAFCVSFAKNTCGPDCSGPAGGAAGQGGSSGAGGSAGGGAGGSAGAGGDGGSAGGGAGGSAGAGGDGGSAGAGGDGGSAGVGGCGTGAPGVACTSSCDCSATQICNTPVPATTSSKCGNVGNGTKELTETCANNGQCKSGYCDIINKTCAVFCDSDDDCGAGNLCGTTLYITQQNGWLPSTCLKPCQRNEDCPPNPGGTPICFLTDVVGNDYVSGACQWVGLTPAQNPSVIKSFGAVGFDSEQHFCDSGFSLILGATQEDICSRGCITDADCADPYPVCGNINATNPSGIGTSLVKACVK